MKTVRGCTVRYRQRWMASAETYTTPMTHDSDTQTLEFELPNGSIVLLSFPEMKELVDSIERRRLAE